MTQATRLRDAIDEAGISVNELARRLADYDGQTPANIRSSLYRWMRGGGISDPWAERLAATLGKESDYFKTPRPEKDELARLRATAAELLEQVEQLQRRLGREAR